MPRRPRGAAQPQPSRNDTPSASPDESHSAAPDDRPSAARGDEVPLLSNDELARIFYEIGDMMELKGEIRFKALAYRRAAEEILHSAAPISQAYREGRPPVLAGVGKAISEKLEELADTGRLRYHERLRTEVPPSLVALLGVPGLGPQTVRQLHERLGVETVADLEAAARDGRLRDVRGMSQRTEERVLAGLAAARSSTVRMRLGEAGQMVDRMTRSLRRLPGVLDVRPAGSFRRRQDTIGDIDLLVATEKPTEVLGRFVAGPQVARVVNQGGHRATVELMRGPQVDVMAMPPDRAGTYLVHFTGSAEHNVALREIARDQGWSLSEHGFLRIGEDGKPLTGDAAELRTIATEEEVYGFLGLPWIAPELREDRGEIEAARAGRLPALVELGDLQGDCHSHSDWSDGRLGIETLAEAMRARGYAYQVLTDHTQSLTIASGLDPVRIEAQRRIVADLNARFALEEREGRAPEGSHPDGFRILHGCELEIRTDGRLDFEDPLLASFDVVVASLHVGRRQPRAQLMARYATALRSPHVDIISHPSGRKIGIRPDLDLDWERFFDEAARTGTLLEINGSDERMDLDDRRARQARQAGCRLVVDSDAHYLRELDNVAFGIAIARRAWLEARDVANTWSRAEFQEWLAGKPGRVRGPRHPIGPLTGAHR